MSPVAENATAPILAKIRVTPIDDEPLSVEEVQRLLAQYRFVEFVQYTCDEGGAP